MVARLFTIVAIFVVAGLSAAIGNAVGLPIGVTAPLGLLTAGVSIVAVMRVFAGGVDDSPVTVAAFVMLFIAALGALAGGKSLWPDASRLLLFGGAVVIEIVAVLLLSALLTAISQRIIRSRQADQRRRLAASHGWDYAPADPDLPAQLGTTDHFVAQLSGQLRIQGQRPVPPEAQAHDIVRGDIGGVPFVAFDCFTSSRLRPPEVTTAWLVRLPRALPLFPSSEIFHAAARTDLALEVPNLPDGDEPASTVDPDYAAAIMSDEIVRFTRERLPSWWVDGDVLASTARVGHGATPELVARTAEAVTTLATLLGEPALARFGTPTSHTGDVRPPVG